MIHGKLSLNLLEFLKVALNGINFELYFRQVGMLFCYIFFLSFINRIMEICRYREDCLYSGTILDILATILSCVSRLGPYYTDYQCIIVYKLLFMYIVHTFILKYYYLYNY